MVCIECKLIDSGEIERYFDRVDLAQMWVKGIGEEYFEYVDMYVPNFNICAEEHHEFFIVSGYQEILEYGRESNQEMV